MTKRKVLSILIHYQQWRRGERSDMPKTKDISEALNKAIAALHYETSKKASKP